MTTLVYDLLDQSLHYDDWRGDFAKAKQETDAWLQKAPEDERPMALLWSAVIAYLQGDITLSQARLNELEKAGPKDINLELYLQTYRLVLMYERYNTFPGSTGAAAVEQTARWRGAADLLEPDQRWQQLYRESGNGAVQWDAWYMYGFLCNLRPVRYMLESTRYSPPAFNREQLLENNLHTIENIRQSAEAAGLPALAVYALWCGADLYFRLGKTPEGIQWLDRAGPIAAGAGDEHGLGLLAMTRGDRLAAPFSSPLLWNFALQDSSSEGSQLSPTVEEAEAVPPAPGVLEEALDCYQTARAHFEKAGSSRALAALSLRDAYLASLRTDYQEAEKAAGKAARQFETAGDEKGLQLARLHRTMTLLGLDRRSEARDIAAGIGRWGKQKGSFTYTLGLGILLNRFARDQLFRKGRYEAALAAYEAAEVLHRELGAAVNAAQNIVDLGTVCGAIGDLNAALLHYARGLDAYESAGRAYLEQMPGGKDIQSNLLQRRTFLASNAYQLALQRVDPEAMAIFAERLKQVMDQMPGKGKDFAEQLGHLLSGTAGTTEQEEGADFWSLRQMGESFLEQSAVLIPLYRSREARRRGDEGTASDEWKKSYTALSQMQLPQRYLFEAIVYAEIENFDDGAEAFHHYEQESGGGWLGSLVELMESAAGEQGRREMVLHQRRQHQQAFSMWSRLRRYADAARHLEALQQLDGDDWWRHDRRPWQMLSDAGETYEGLSNYARAADCYEQAFKVLEARRNQLSRDEWKTAIASDRGAQYLYFLAARNAFKLKEYQRAFTFIERGKARSLLDLMAGGSARLEAAGAEDQLLRQWRQCSAELTLHRGLLAAEHSRQQASGERISQLEQRINKDEKALHELEKALSKTYPQFYQAVSPEGKLLSVQEVAGELREKDLLLEYALLGEDLLIWAIDAQGLKGAFHFELNVEALERDIDQLLERLQHPRALEPLLSGISEKLIAPVAKLLREVRQLYVIPYGALHRLPFHALLLDGKALCSLLPVSYLPSASLLQYLQAATIPQDAALLAVGNPTGDLRNAAAEAAFVAQLYGREALLGSEATEERVREQIGRTELIHLATHGYADESAPLRSAVALAHGERLTLYEMMGLRLRADLVVLSACETAVGATTGGDEVIGLTRGLLAAGAKAALVSLWKVDDLSTSLFMRFFHQALRKGEAPARALQAAQQRMLEMSKAEIEEQLTGMKKTGQNSEVRQALQRGFVFPEKTDTGPADDGTLRHPYYWAPFVLVGR